MRLGIRLKVLTALSLSLLVIFGLVSFFVIRQNMQALESGLEERTKTFAQLATKPIGDTFVLYKDSGRLRISQQVNRFTKLDNDITSIAIVNVNGEQIYGNNQSAIKPGQLTSFDTQYERNKQGRINRVIEPYIEDSGAHRYSVVYSVSDKRITTALQETVRLIIYVAAAVLIVSLLGTNLLMDQLFLRPLAKVSRQSKIISSGQLDQAIETSRQDEIGDLARSVNAMAESLKADIVKLQEVDQLKSEFLMITSHNLRTPLSIMKGYIEMADDTNDPQVLKKTVQDISINVKRLQLFAEDVLAISTLESGAKPLQRTSMPFQPFISTLSEEFQALAKDKGLEWKFESHLQDQTKVTMNQHHIRSAIGNVYDNAIKFTPHGGHVEVKVDIKDNQVRLIVRDSGIGIAPSETSKLFTKFHRGTSTLQYDYEGVGIGLYLTRLILQQHDGAIVIDSKENEGTTVTITLPLS